MNLFNYQTPLSMKSQQTLLKYTEIAKNSTNKEIKRTLKIIGKNSTTDLTDDVPTRSGARGCAPLVWSPVYTGP